MTDKNAEKIQKLIAQNKLGAAITLAEELIKKRKVADFHGVLGKDLLPLTSALADYITSFYSAAAKEIDVKALYVEMNGFTINYDRWFVQLFAYNTNAGREDTDWLADYTFTVDENFPITGLEEIQAVYADYMDNDKWASYAKEAAAEDCAVLIVLRLHELVQAAKEYAKANGLAWATIPLYATAHDTYFDMVYEAK